MARYQIPKSPGEVKIIESKAGSPLIYNNQKGKNKVSIPCRDWDHAEEILEKIKSLNGGGEIWT